MKLSLGGRFFIYLSGACTAGLCTGMIWGLGRNSGDIYTSDFTRSLLLAVGSFFISAVILCARKQKNICGIPVWVLIPVLGGVLSFISIVLAGNRWFTKNKYLSGSYIQEVPERIANLFLSVFVDCMIALPIMAIFHYFFKRLQGTNRPPAKVRMTERESQ